MGIRPIDWQELKAWSDMTRTEITPQQAVTLIKSSESYVQAYQAGSNPHAPDPTTDSDYDMSTSSAIFSRQLVKMEKEEGNKKGA